MYTSVCLDKAHMTEAGSQMRLKIMSCKGGVLRSGSPCCQGHSYTQAGPQVRKNLFKRNLADSQMTFICPGRMLEVLACSAAGYPPCHWA